MLGEIWKFLRNHITFGRKGNLKVPEMKKEIKDGVESRPQGCCYLRSPAPLARSCVFCCCYLRARLWRARGELGVPLNSWYWKTARRLATGGTRSGRGKSSGRNQNSQSGVWLCVHMEGTLNQDATINVGLQPLKPVGTKQSRKAKHNTT